MLTVDAGAINAEDTRRAEAAATWRTVSLDWPCSRQRQSVCESRGVQPHGAEGPLADATELGETHQGQDQAYAEDPAAQANNVTALNGQGGLIRLRVGDWRVIIRDEAVLTILSVSSRGDAYKE